MRALPLTLALGWSLVSGTVFAQAPVLSSIEPAFGFGGSQLVVQGTGLGTADIVFGDGTVAAVISRDSDTRLTVRVPPTPLPYPGMIDVRARRDTSWSNTLTFQYLAEQLAAPSIYRLSQRCAVLGYEPTVLVEGDNFGARTTVFFGSNPATVTALSPTMLQVTVPSGSRAEWVDVSIRNEDTGRVTLLRSGFGYAPAAPPTIESLSPVPGVAGFSLSITGSGFVTAGTRVRLAGRELADDQVAIEACNSMWITVPEDVEGTLLLEVTTPVGSVTSDLQVEPPGPSGMSGASCQLGTYEAPPDGHLVDELYGRRWREPESSAFFRGELGTGRLWMRDVPQCTGVPPVRPELKVRLSEGGSYLAARDCNPSSCIPNQGRSYELRQLGVFQEPQSLDVQIKCSNGNSPEYPSFLTLYVPPTQVTDRFTNPPIINPGGEVTVTAKNLAQTGNLIAPQKVRLFVREGLDGAHRIVWSQDYGETQICLGCADRPVRIQPDSADPSGHTFLVRIQVPNVANLVGRDVFVSLINERSDCQRVFVDQSSFPTLLFHDRAPGAFDLLVQPETPISFHPSDADGTTALRTLRVVRRVGVDRYAGDVKIQATLESSVDLNLSLALNGGRSEEYCQGANCAVVYLAPEAAEANLTLSVRKTAALPPGITRATIRIRATYPPRETQFTQEKLVDVYISPSLGLLQAGGNLAEGRVGVGYDNTQIQAQGGVQNYRWWFCGVAGPPAPANCLPDGLAIQLQGPGSSIVQIYGTPSTEQTRSFAVRVQDQTGEERTATYGITTRQPRITFFGFVGATQQTDNQCTPSGASYQLRVTTSNFDFVPDSLRNVDLTITQPADHPYITVDPSSFTAPLNGSIDLVVRVGADFVRSHRVTFPIQVRAVNPVAAPSGIFTNPNAGITILRCCYRCDITANCATLSTPGYADDSCPADYSVAPPDCRPNWDCRVGNAYCISSTCCGNWETDGIVHSGCTCFGCSGFGMDFDRDVSYASARANSHVGCMWPRPPQTTFCGYYQNSAQLACFIARCGP